MSRRRGRTTPTSGASSVPARRGLQLSGLAALALAISGCTGGGSAAPITSGTTPPPVTTSATSSPTSTAPTLPEAAKANTRTGAEAFFRYFWDVYNYSFANLTTEQLQAISDQECKFCSQGKTNVQNAVSAGRSFSGGLVTLDVVVVGPIESSGGAIVNAVISQASGKLVAADGTTARSFPPQNRIRADGGVRWEDSRWVMIEVVLGPDDRSTP